MTSDLMYMYNMAGALELFKYQHSGKVTSLSSPTTRHINVQMASRDEMLRTAWDSTQLLCIHAKDDLAMDMMQIGEICGSKLAAHSLVYPKKNSISVIP